MFKIRRATPDDTLDMHDMMQVCFEGNAVKDVTEHTWWIARDLDEEPAGFACLAKSLTQEHGGYLAYAGVMPKYRGQGLQKRLIRVRAREAKHLGYTVLVTDTCDNPPSANSLIACGFRMYDPASPWALANSVYWKRKLA